MISLVTHDLHYRPEVDGLRAVAVLAVLGFHAGFAPLRGGFAGVDVFFVISGYLITRILAREFDTGTFSFARFYERRARRLLPALGVVLLSCSAMAWHWLPPVDLVRFTRSLLATLAFVPNLLAWREVGYFGEAAELEPLLHTWSLGVEEQYYLLYPAALLLLWRAPARHRILAIAAATGSSFALAQWASTTHPIASFYLLPTRGWELGVGALIALAPTRCSRRPHVDAAASLAAATGLLLILLTCMLHDVWMPYPDVHALMPVLGAALFIRYASPHNLAGRVLSSAPFVGIGLISYSAYLWHHPLLVFARQRALDLGQPPPGAAINALLLGLALLLAYATYRWIERPCRDRHALARPRFLLGAASAAVALLVLAGFLRAVALTPGSMPPNVAHASLGEKIESIGDVCTPAPLVDQPDVDACEFGDRHGDGLVIVYGDSHAHAMMHELHRRLRTSGRRGVWLRLTGCASIPYLPGSHEVASASDCERRFARLRDWLRANPGELLIAFRWSYHLYPIAGAIDSLGFDNSEGGLEMANSQVRHVARDDTGRFTESGEVKARAASRFLRELIAESQAITLVYPIPEIGWDIARLNWAHWREHGATMAELSIPTSDYEARNRYAIALLDALGDVPGLRRVRPDAVFCDRWRAGRCVAQIDGVPFYVDDDHLSDAGAALVLDEVFRAR
jgi:peptidoglycan/LPS O-acetylase OafA/YrhL